MGRGLTVRGFWKDLGGNFWGVRKEKLLVSIYDLDPVTAGLNFLKHLFTFCRCM